MNLGNRSNSNIGVLVPILLAGIGIVVGGLIIGQFTSVVFPTQASAESEQVDSLFQVLLIIGGAIFLLVQGLLLYSVIRFRVKPDDTEDGPTIHGNTLLELVWTAIPAVIVLVLVIYSYQVWIDVREAKDGETTIHVTAQRFAWSFSYDDSRLDPLRDTVTNDETGEEEPGPPVRVNSNILHTYVGENVRLEMNTRDVIHSFWIPEMRIKQDVIPGRTTEIRFTPIAVENAAFPQVYRVVCTELCGPGHGGMFSFVYVHEDEEAMHEAFLDPAVDLVLNPPPDPALRGAQVVQGYACTGCHTLQDSDAGINWTAQLAPNLNGVGDRAATRVPGQTAEEYLYNSLYYPSSSLVTGFGALMPQFQPGDPNVGSYMPTDHVYAIVAYLCSRVETGENACDLDNLLTLINSDNPDNPVILDADAPDAEATAEPTGPEIGGADATGEAEATADPEATALPEATAEATPAAEETESADAGND
jgi:cytochrome c oxidase subunit 2